RAPLPERAPDVAAPTSLTWGVLSGSIDVRGAELPWPAGQVRDLEVALQNAGPATWLAAASDPGGVILSVGWRSDPLASLIEPRWYPVSHAVGAGETVEIQVRLRRPARAARELVIEPHVRSMHSFDSGPTWTLEVEGS
ncbi:MAG: hypothetical protein ACRD0X_00060, partial [Thermoanaerobaculia bacterium]